MCDMAPVQRKVLPIQDALPSLQQDQTTLARSVWIVAESEVFSADTCVKQQKQVAEVTQRQIKFAYYQVHRIAQKTTTKIRSTTVMIVVKRSSGTGKWTHSRKWRL